MLIYWVLFFFFAVGTLAAPAFRPGGLRHFPIFLIFGTVALVVVMGFRYKVGADWTGYAFIFQRAAYFGFVTMLREGDPAYQAINWWVYHAGIEIWLVNLICAVIFCWGIYRFAMAQPAPWLAFAIAVPYIVIVVGMGYTRQGVALAIVMAGLARQAQGASSLNFAAYVAAAATFHASATIMFPLVSIAGKGNRVINLLAAAAVTYFLYDFFIGENMDRFVDLYIRTGQSSQGALIRVTLNLVPAAIFFLAGKRLGFDEHEYKIWRNFALASVGFALALAVTPSSTAVDRLSVYIMPLQVAVLTRTALLGANQLVAAAAVVTYAGLIQFVWLNFSDHANAWIPYQFYPL